MNNDLEQFSEERLKEISELTGAYEEWSASQDEIHALARIALAAKQAKPVAWTSQSNLDAVALGIPNNLEFMSGDKGVYKKPVPLYTTQQPAHTEQEITDNVRDALEKALNAMQFMGDTLNNLDAVCAEDVEHVTPAFEAIRKLLAAATKPESE